MVICKTNEAHIAMKQKFQERSEIHKKYHVIVVGKPKYRSRVIQNYITRHPKIRHKMTVTDDRIKGFSFLTSF